MHYRFLIHTPNGSRAYDWLEMWFDSRSDCVHFVESVFDELQEFSVYESGHIEGYAVELSEKDKPQAILYFHKVAQLIWIDMY